MLNIKDIEFPMMLNQIKKFENQKNVSINVYSIEKKKYLSILSIRFADKKISTLICCTYRTTKGPFCMEKIVYELSSIVSWARNRVKKSTKNTFAIDTYTHLKKL